MEGTTHRGLQAYKRLPFAPCERPLTQGIQELYVADGSTTILYRYEHNAKSVIIRSIETFPASYLDLMRRTSQSQFYPVNYTELKAVWNEECAMITRQRNKLRAGINLIQ